MHSTQLQSKSQYIPILPQSSHRKYSLWCSQKCREIHMKIAAPVSFIIKLYASIIKETLAHVFSCEFCEISKNTFFTDTSGRLLLYYHENELYKYFPILALLSSYVMLCAICYHLYNFKNVKNTHKPCQPYIQNLGYVIQTLTSLIICGHIS